MPNFTNKTLSLQIRQLKNAIFQFSHFPFADVLSTDDLEQIVEHSTSSRE